MNFEMELSSVQKIRKIYSFWDFLGDVGGLNDILTLIGGCIVSLVQMFTGSGLNRYIFKKLFMFEETGKKKQLNKTLLEQIRSQTERWQSATFPWCNWLRNWRNKRMKTLYETANRRIYRELDLVRFIQ